LTVSCYHRLGAVGVRFVVRITALSDMGVREDLNLARATGYTIELGRPDGTILERPGTKDRESNDIAWVDTEGVLDQQGTWSLGASVRFGDGTRVRAANKTLFGVIS